MTSSPTMLTVLMVALLAVAAGPVRAASDSPFVIDKKAFKQRVKSVSLSPLSAPEMLALSDATRALIEAEATKQLGKTRLEAIGIEPYAQLRKTMAEQIGGLMTADGTVDARRQATVWDHAKREMRMRYPVDAFAEISLRVVNAPFSRDRAEFDGVKLKVKSSGGGKDYEGTIAAASFQLAIYDRSDELLFVNRHGIELLQERVGPRLMLRRTETMLQDEKKLRKAVQAAFKPL